MRRADRLFQILQVLRRATRPITAEAIAEELETSKRTIYRDIHALLLQDVPIRGEAGVGYVLDRGFDLPPLMLTADELEAVALGAAWVTANADAGLARAARDALSKITAIAPASLRPVVTDPAVGTLPPRNTAAVAVDVAQLRRWCRFGRKLTLHYVDAAGHPTERVIWPFFVGYMPGARIVAAWCELRQDERIFRLDRIAAVRFHDERYPEAPSTLRRRWLTAIQARRAADGTP